MEERNNTFHGALRAKLEHKVKQFFGLRQEYG